MYQLKKEDVEKLDALRSDAAWASRNTSILNDKGDVKGVSNVIVCRLIERQTKRVWIQTEGTNEEEALHKALASASPGKRPRTPSELAEENVSLRKRIAELEGKPTDDVTPPLTEEVEDLHLGADPDDQDEVPDPADNMTSSEILQALKSRSITAPDGDRRTSEWRKAALAALQS